MFLVAVDAYSKWPEVKVMSTTSTTKTLDVLREWFSAHGIPEHIVTDNGPQFIAEEFEIFTKRNGIKHVKSAPYHPASNGLAERFIQSLKQSLKASQQDGRSLSQRISTYLRSDGKESPTWSLLGTRHYSGSARSCLI
jgi:transposase InsO family protein